MPIPKPEGTDEQKYISDCISEISNEYCNIIEERIKKAWEEKRKEKDLTQKTLFGDGM